MKKAEPKKPLLRWIPSAARMTLALAFSSWLMFHTFSYDTATHEFRIAFKLWSDFAAHIPLIRSFSIGPNLDRLLHFQTIEYPIFPGEPIRYHFLFDMFVGLLEKIGLRIDWALNIPSIIGFTLLLISIYILAKKLFQSTAVAFLSVIFFLFNGSLSFIRFFELHPLSVNSWQDIFRVKDFPSFAPWGPGDITAFWNLNIYTNQRHLAGAFALILFFIITCLQIKHKPITKQLPWAVVWAVLIGILPYYHQPTLLIMAVLMLCYFILFPNLRKFLCATGIWSLVLVVPQFLLTKDNGNPIQWYPGYIIHNEVYQLNFLEKLWRMIIFWWNNLGFHSIFMLIGFFLIPRQAKKIISPVILIFLIGNLFKFSIEASANHKFFNFVMILGEMISAYVLVLLAKRIRIRLLAYSLISVFLVLLTLSGIIDIFPIVNDTIGSTHDIQANETILWIAQNTPKDAIFLNTSFMYDPASITGRAIFLGWPYFSWSAGYNTIERSKIMETIHTNPNPKTFCPILLKNHITHVVIRKQDDQNLPDIDVDYFRLHFTPAYQTSDKHNPVYIFTSAALCYE